MQRAYILIACALVFFLSIFANATAQSPDILIIDGKKVSIYTNPLRPWLELDPNRLPKTDVMSSGLWRGYVATWEVRDSKLTLVDVEMLRAKTQKGKDGFSTEFRSVFSQMFPGQKGVAAEWFTGHIIVPEGKQVQYVHMGYASLYEKYTILRVEQGTVTETSKMDTKGYRKFRDAQFEQFKKTDEYRKALAETSGSADSLTPAQNEEFLREYYAEEYMSRIFPKSVAEKE